MSKRELVRNLKVVQSILPQVLTGTVLTGATGVDTRGYGSAMVAFSTGAIASSGLFTPSVHESDDDVTYTAVAAADLQGTALANLAASAIQKVGYIGSKRYIKASAAYVSGTSIAIAANVTLGTAEALPVV